MSSVSMIGLGIGLKEHLTFGAYNQLINSDYIYVMTKPGSWMENFVRDIVGEGKIRTYMPNNVKWNSGWQKDPIFLKIVDEVEKLVAEGQQITFAMAGDVAIYGNVADSIIPILREKNITWKVFPGVSFLNALSISTGEPIVGENDNFVVTFARSIDELDAAFASANVVVLYNPAECYDLRKYIKSRKVLYAKMVLHGVYNRTGKIIDLLTDWKSKIHGIVILKRGKNVILKKSIASKSKGDKINETKISYLSHHLGVNGWDSRNRFFAACFPDRLMWSSKGNPENIQLRYKFPDSPSDIRGLFIDSKDNIYIGLKGFKKGRFGRTFLSEDSGETFKVAFEQCFWGMDEDKSNNLFAGVYHERNEPDASCSVLWSADGGTRWADISAPQWKDQLHVHHVAVNPSTGWLYACLGDKKGLRGCWRSKVITVDLVTSCDVGCWEIMLSKDIKVSPGDILVSSSGLRMVVDTVEGSIVRITNPLSQCLSRGCKLMKLDWELKFADSNNTLQFIGICFKGEYIYLSDDTGPVLNLDSAIVYRARDDGGSQPTSPEPVLKASKGYGWGSFFLECDRNGRIWTAVRPVTGKGSVWYSDDGLIWISASETLSEDVPCWRGTHTYRDSTLQQTGYGRFLSEPDIGIVVPHLSRSLVIK